MLASCDNRGEELWVGDGVDCADDCVCHASRRFGAQPTFALFGANEKHMHSIIYFVVMLHNLLVITILA
jgi:hypothetical protein